MRIKITSTLCFLLLVLLAACGPSDPPAADEAVPPSALSGNPAIDALTAKILEEPLEADLYAQRGALWYENEGYDQAIDDLRKAISLDSSQAMYQHLLADVFLDYFQSRKALETMERAARQFPEQIPTLLKLSEFQLILKQYEASLRTIDRILRVDPNEPEAYFMMGMNFKETGDTARAINSFQEAVELDPRLIDGWIFLGQLQAAVGNAIAERYFDTALELRPEYIPAIHAKADYLREQDRLPEAISTYARITPIDPQYADAYFNSGLLYMELDSVEAAYRQFDMCLQVEPTHVRAYFFRGLAAEMMDRQASARADYEQALRLAPDYEEARSALRQLQALQ